MMQPLPLSLIQFSSLAEAMAWQAYAAKVMASAVPDASARHLKNARTLHEQITKLLDAADAAAVTGA